MSFFTFDEGAAKSADSKGSIDTGVYKAKIDTASLTVASTGTKGIDFSFELEDGRKALVYGMYYEKADGSKLMDNDKINSLLGILGIKSLSTYQKTIDVKDGKKIVEAIKELDQKQIMVALNVEHDIYNGEERNKLRIYGFFNKDGFSYSELVAKVDEPKKIEYVRKNLKDTFSKAFKAYNAEGESFAAPTGSSLL